MSSKKMLSWFYNDVTIDGSSSMVSIGSHMPQEMAACFGLKEGSAKI